MTSINQNVNKFKNILIHVILAPATFRVVMQLIKPFLSSRTQNIIWVFGRNEKTWGEYLDQEIDKEERRPEFGGTKQDVPVNGTMMW